MDLGKGDLLKQFIALGEGSSYDTLVAFVGRVSLKRANDFAWTIREHAATLSGAQLSDLVKVFTCLENAFGPEFCGGSTTQVPILLMELRKRDRLAAAELTAWAFEHAKNPYNPFGTDNSSRRVAVSVSEYHGLETRRIARIQESESERTSAAKDRAEHRCLLHSQRLLAHESYNERRRILLAELAQLPSIERLRRLTTIGDWRPGALLTEYADQTAAMHLGIDEQKLLLLRLERAPRGPWSKLRDCLTVQNQK